MVVVPDGHFTLNQRNNILSSWDGKKAPKRQPIWGEMDGLARSVGKGMYSRQISVKYEVGGHLTACPIKWLDNFSMRNFTNDSIFDDTLPVADGVMRIGTRVPLAKLKEAMEDWFRRKSYIGKEQELVVEEKS